MESACNREQFGSTHYEDAVYIHALMIMALLLTIMHYNKETILYIMYTCLNLILMPAVCVYIILCSFVQYSGM